MGWNGHAWYRGAASVSRSIGAPDNVTWAELASISLNGQPRVYYRAVDSYIYELGWDGSNWSYVNILQSSGGSLPGTGSMTVKTCEGDPRVYYIDDVGFIVEVIYAGGWVNHRRLDFPRPCADSELTSLSLNGQPRVYYQGEDFHVHEIGWDGSNWFHKNLGQLSGGPTATFPTPLTSTFCAGNPRVYYLTDDRHIHEMAWDGSNWNHLCITDAAYAPPTSQGSPLTSVDYNGNPRVYYRYEGQVHELGWGPGWFHNALPSEELTDGSFLSSMTYHGDPRIYYMNIYWNFRELSWRTDRWEWLDRSIP